MSFTEATEKTVNFQGKAGEWFGIWIVNLLLSIITIGIYSAWAKVRRLKYFYKNTYIEGRNFDHHATGKQILIGRLIFIAGYVVYVLIGQLAPALFLILTLGLLALIPWLLVRAMKFNARMTSFSNVRFDFSGTMGRAALVYIVVPLALYIGLIAIFLGAGYLFFGNVPDASQAPLGIGFMALLALTLLPLAFAFYDRMVKEFSINHHLLGDAAFSLDIGLRPFIMAQLAAVAWVLIVGGAGWRSHRLLIHGICHGHEPAGIR